MAVNPTDKEYAVEYNAKAEECIYSYNGGAVIDGGKITVKPMSAAYIRIAR